MAAFAAMCALCVIVCSSFTVSLACEGPYLLKMVNVLEDVNDWETLSECLDVGRGVINMIREKCYTQHHGDLALCFRMKLVEYYCEKTARTPRRVADDIADVLDKCMSMKKQADKLRHLKLGWSADSHPPSLSDSTCNGPDLWKIVRVLEEVTNWETLSLWLDVESGVWSWIKDDCLRQKNVATCCRMELVQHYCDKTARSLRQVADDMADVLENCMSKKTQADKLRQFMFTGIADRHPPSLSDSTTQHSLIVGPLGGYWVFIAVALALIAVTTCIYQIHTRAGPLPGVPHAGAPPAGVPHTGVPPPRVPHAGVPPPRVPHAGVPHAGVPPPRVSHAGVPPAGVPPPRVPHAGVPPPRVPHAGAPPAGVPPPRVPHAGAPPAGVPPDGAPPAGVPLLGVTSADHTIHPGYERVCRNMVKLTMILEANPAARHKLTLYYKEYKWLDITEYPTEDELVTLALMRIKQDPSQYDRFVATLRAIEGMDLIVDAITAEQHHFPTPDEPAHDMTVEPAKFADLLNELLDVAHKWRIIGLMLGLSHGSIARIEKDNDTVHHRMIEMLGDWKNRESSTYTWQTIVEALKSKAVNEQYLARHIEQKYIILLKRNN